MRKQETCASYLPELWVLCRQRSDHSKDDGIGRRGLMPIRIAVDTMGGDLGPDVIVSGAMQYLLEKTSDGPELIFVGPKQTIGGILTDLKVSDDRISVVNADDVIAMDATPTDAIRKKEASLVVAHRLVKSGEADAMVSAGNTGAVLASAMFNLGRIEGVSRPALASPFPTSNKKPCLVLDVGANAQCRADHLLEFAHMGSIYFSQMMNVPRPRVALLSIGEEANKGNDLTVEAHRRLSSSSLNFIGNVEGRDLLNGKSDVIVCDGFVGNILIKFAESMRGFLYGKIKRQISSNPFSRLGAILMGPFLRRIHKTFDYSQYGGVPLLGTNGVTIVCHGSSNALAVMNAIRVANEAVAKEINKHISDQLSSIRSISQNVREPGSE